MRSQLPHRRGQAVASGDGARPEIVVAWVGEFFISLVPWVLVRGGDGIPLKSFAFLCRPRCRIVRRSLTGTAHGAWHHHWRIAAAVPPRRPRHCFGWLDFLGHLA